MKKILALLTVLVLLLTGCTMGKPKNQTVTDGKSGVSATGLWITYSEINSMLTSQNGFENEVEFVAENCQMLGIENVYIHVRSHCDSLFKSEYFPLKKEAQNYSKDAFQFMIDTFKAKEIKVHAWINPYRVSTSSSDIASISEESPAFKWLNDDTTENDTNVCISGGIYLNPAEQEVIKLVTDGVREIINKYPVDGIHFDDYFYPTTDAQFDKISYEKYTSKTQNPLSLEDFRRTNVNLLISGCKSAVEYADRDIIFSVSPAASIEKNYNVYYADVKHWLKNGLVDVIIPQLYFGFNYGDSNFRFENILKEWKELASVNSDTELHIGLAVYKTGTQNDADGTEWIEDTDIIARQAEICRDDGIISGYVLFSYSSVFSSAELNTKQRENYRSLIKE